MQNPSSRAVLVRQHLLGWHRASNEPCLPLLLQGAHRHSLQPPKPEELQGLVGPVGQRMGEAQSLAEDRRSPALHQAKAAAEALQALTWVVYTGPSCGETLCGSFARAGVQGAGRRHACAGSAPGQGSRRSPASPDLGLHRPLLR